MYATLNNKILLPIFEVYISGIILSVFFHLALGLWDSSINLHVLEHCHCHIVFCSVINYKVIHLFFCQWAFGFIKVIVITNSAAMNILVLPGIYEQNLLEYIPRGYISGYLHFWVIC